MCGAVKINALYSRRVVDNLLCNTFLERWNRGERAMAGQLLSRWIRRLLRRPVSRRVAEPAVRTHELLMGKTREAVHELLGTPPAATVEGEMVDNHLPPLWQAQT